MGIVGKKPMWRALGASDLPNISRWDFEKLERSAGQQVEQVEAERIKTARQAFDGTSVWTD